MTGGVPRAVHRAALARFPEDTAFAMELIGVIKVFNCAGELKDEAYVLLERPPTFGGGLIEPRLPDLAPFRLALPLRIASAPMPRCPHAHAHKSYARVRTSVC